MMTRVIRRRAGAVPAEFGRELHPAGAPRLMQPEASPPPAVTSGPDQLLPVSSLERDSMPQSRCCSNIWPACGTGARRW